MCLLHIWTQLGSVIILCFSPLSLPCFSYNLFAQCGSHRAYVHHQVIHLKQGITMKYLPKTRGIATMKLNWQQRKKYMTTKAQLSTRRVTLATRSMATSLSLLSVAVSATVPTLSLSTTNRFRVSIPPDALYIVVSISMICTHHTVDHRTFSWQSPKAIAHSSCRGAAPWLFRFVWIRKLLLMVHRNVKE